MKGRIGTKHYDTDKATLIDTLPDGVQVYRKKGGTQEYFIYNPAGTVAREKFFDLPAEQALKYMPEQSESRVFMSTKMVRLSPADSDRIKRLAYQNGMSMTKFVMMLVDDYENKQK